MESAANSLGFGASSRAKCMGNLPARLVEEPTAANSSEAMARLLHSANPRQAVRLARAAHEKACEGYDEGNMAFWAQVVALLSVDRAEARRARRNAFFGPFKAVTRVRSPCGAPIG